MAGEVVSLDRGTRHVTEREGRNAFLGYIVSNYDNYRPDTNGTFYPGVGRPVHCKKDSDKIAVPDPDVPNSRGSVDELLGQIDRLVPIAQRTSKLLLPGQVSVSIEEIDALLADIPEQADDDNQWRELLSREPALV